MNIPEIDCKLFKRNLFFHTLLATQITTLLFLQVLHRFDETKFNCKFLLLLAGKADPDTPIEANNLIIVINIESNLHSQLFTYLSVPHRPSAHQHQHLLCFRSGQSPTRSPPRITPGLTTSSSTTFPDPAPQF